MIIGRYLLGEVLRTFAAVLAVLLVVFLSHRFVHYLADAASGAFPGELIFRMLVLKVVTVLPVLAPFAAYMGVLLVLGRWRSDREMVALASAGGGPWTVLRPLAGLASMLAVVVAVLALYLSPRAAAFGYELRRQAQSITDFSAVAAGRFVESASGRWVLYAEGYSEPQHALVNVFARGLRRGGEDLFAAERASVTADNDTGRRWLVTGSGYRYIGSPGRADYWVVKYGRQAVALEAAPVRPSFTRRDALPTKVLLKSRQAREHAELQWRLSMPLSVLVLVALGGGLSSGRGRSGRAMGLLVAVLVYAIYYNTLALARSWVEQGVMPVWAGHWPVHGVVAFGTAVLLWRNVHAGRWPGP